MPEFQLSHIALVGARIDAFTGYGISNRNELRMRRIPPLLRLIDDNPDCSVDEWRASLAAEFPLWVHNIITDPDFPGRKKLLMPLRRFEGEIKDKKDNEVVSAVMTAGFKSQAFNPLDLPKTLPMRRRCTMLAHIGVWQEAYLKLEDELLDIMSEEAPAVHQWCERARQPEYATVETVE
jgi:hypothetical protein